MNSPPKKRVHTPSTVKWGGGIPTSSCTSSPNHSVTQNIPTPPNGFAHSSKTLYDTKFDVIVEEPHRHDARIVSLETTTNSIDANADRILHRMEDNYPSAHKVQKTGFFQHC
jgi:hypothetical protein